jgi:hypothetical protein
LTDGCGISFLVQLRRAHDGPVRLENVPAMLKCMIDMAGLTEALGLGSD